MESVRITVLISKELRTKIKQIAAKEKRSMSNVVRILLNDAMKNKKRPPGNNKKACVEHPEG